MLEVNGLTRKYKQFVAVDEVSFTINKGEIIGLLGHNGAGKTTIMKMLSGFIEPDQGQISFDGLPLQENLKRIQAHLGYLPENLPVYPDMMVADYLDYAAVLKGLSGAEKTAEIKRVVQATDISAKLLEPIANLSRGYKQRVGVAQAILAKPKLLILDEPTNGLDPQQTQQMRDLIIDIAKEATVILSTHIMQEVEALCSRVLIVNAGKLVVDEHLSALKQGQQITIETSLNEQESKQLLTIEGIEDIKPVKQSTNTAHFQYSVSVALAYDMTTVCAEIANTIIKADQQLFSLVPQKRDLETLFKEVNQQQYQQQEDKNAA